MKQLLVLLIGLVGSSLYAADGALQNSSGTTTTGGSIPAANIPSYVITNNWQGPAIYLTNAVTATTFTGTGAGQGFINLSNAGGTASTVILGPSNVLVNATYFSNTVSGLPLLTNAIGCTFSGGGSALTPGAVVYSIVPYDCKIIGAYMVGVPSGSAVIEVEQCSQTAFDGGATHPVSGDKITSSTPPTITTSTKNGNTGDTTLSSWNVYLTNQNVVAFSVTSCTTITNLTLALRVTHSPYP